MILWRTISRIFHIRLSHHIFCSPSTYANNTSTALSVGKSEKQREKTGIQTTLEYSWMILDFFLALSFQDLHKRKHDENIKHTSKSINKSLLQIAFKSVIFLISASKIWGKRWRFLCSNDVILSFLREVWIAWKKSENSIEVMTNNSQIKTFQLLLGILRIGLDVTSLPPSIPYSRTQNDANLLEHIL